jgi:glucose-inhibited division protein A
VIEYEVIVIGGGHAGIEAAMSVATSGHKVALITENRDAIGYMPCNPSVGGSAKGIVVREIAALGGVMGQLADQSLLQIKMLNQRKGPAVWSLRAQVDVEVYPKLAQAMLTKHSNITIIEHRVETLIIQENNQVSGVVLQNGENILAQIVIVTTGTYMDSAILLGHSKTAGGPNGYKTSTGLSNCFRQLGLELFRLKTGTPARVDGKTINYDAMEVQHGDQTPWTFSFQNQDQRNVIAELPCYLTYAKTATIKIIQDNLEKSAMYSGKIEGVGPRYCPSIEDKVVRFSDKERHQIFVEPLSASNDLMYIQGMSTSMPEDVQKAMLRAIPGLEQCEIVNYGYAIEYDAIKPTQLFPTLETKKINGLFTAGQINGTSGYEEAAAQGLIAGINAVRKLTNRPPLILSRDESYIGVMIDDLVTKGTKDPYRLLTSRAEHRLLLRHDNADLRLTTYGYEAGLIAKKTYHELQRKIKVIKLVMQTLDSIRITPKKEIIAYLVDNNLSGLHDGTSAATLLKRPEISWDILLELIDIMQYSERIARLLTSLSEPIINQVVIQIKYDGYIKKAQQQVIAAQKLEYKKIPSDIDYTNVPNIALEAREKLAQIQPLTLGQASRIAGVNAVDITMLDLYLSKKKLSK